MLKSIPVMIGIGLLASCAVLFAFLFAPGPTAKPEKAQLPAKEESWLIESFNRDQAIKDAFAKLTKNETENFARAAAPINWKFLGVIKDGKERRALIDNEKKLERLGVGDSLPDGANLSEIKEDSIVIGKNGELHSKKLYE